MLEYWSRIILWLLTFTNWPLVKYIPSAIENADPADVASETNVDANGSPATIVVLADITSLSTLNSSSSKNLDVELSLEPDPTYFT